MPLHLMEPWLIEHQFARFNLAESGVENATVKELLHASGGSIDEFLALSLQNQDTRGSMGLRRAVASVYEGADADSMLITTGTSEAIFIYFSVRYQPGANVVVPVPAFQTLYEVPRYLGWEVRLLRLRPENRFRPDLDELTALIDDHTKVIVVNTPHNPTGVVLTEAELERIVEVADRRGAEVLLDEHYRFLPHDGREILPSAWRPNRRVIGVGSMIKCFGCVGLRVGWLLGPKDLLDACRDFKDYTTHTVCSMTEFLARICLERWREIAGKYRSWVVANVDLLDDFVKQHSESIGWIRPEGGAVSFPWLRQSVDVDALLKRMVEEAGVSMLPGSAFEMPNHLRVGFGIKPGDFRIALEIFSRYLRGDP
jgi:aspartate/methionine/tyrosine aminotransferase